MTMPAPGADQWVRLPRRRLATAGARVTDAVQWTTRIGLIFLALAFSWWIFTALRPLPAPVFVDDLAAISPPSPAADDAAGVERRREILSRLNRENLFDAERMAWTMRAEAPPESPQQAPAAQPTAAPGAAAESIAGKKLIVTGPDSIPEDVKQALTGLALRGIFLPPGSQEPAALISRVHAGTNPLASDVFRAGDEFEDKQHPQAKWKVMAVDAPRRRVILQRSNINVALRLYATGAPAAPLSAAPEPESPKSPVLVARTRDEVEADLRAANLSEEQIRRLLQLAEMTDDEARASIALEEMARAKPPEEVQQQTGRRAPPPGLEAIARLLQQAPTIRPDPEPPAEEEPK